MVGKLVMEHQLQEEEVLVLIIQQVVMEPQILVVVVEGVDLIMLIFQVV